GSIATQAGTTRFPSVKAATGGGAYGAGDSFAGALVYYLAGGMSGSESCMRAAAHGAAGWGGPHPRAAQKPLSPLPPQRQPVTDQMVAQTPQAATNVRAQALAAATRRFAAQGVGATSIQEIADEVGVTKQAILHHFPSKERLRDAVLEAMLAHWQERLPRI